MSICARVLAAALMAGAIAAVVAFPARFGPGGEPGRVIVAPPSLPLIMRRESLGSTQSSCVSPCGMRIRVNVRPPSVDFHVDRFITYIMFSSDGSADTTL